MSVSQRALIWLAGWSLVVWGGTWAVAQSDGIGDIAARQFYSEGQAALNREDLKTAAKRFGQAMQAAPGDGRYPTALSAVFLRQGQISRAWRLVRQGIRLSPGDPRVAAQFLNVWNRFGQQRLFHVGNTPAKVEKTLGQPDHQNAVGTSERWFYGFMAIDWSRGQLYSSVDLRGLDAANEQPQARLVLELDPAWRVSFRVADNQQQTTSYQRQPPESTAGPANQPTAPDEAAPPAALIIQRLYRVATEGISPRQWMERARRAAQQADAVNRWELLAEDDERVIYEWNSKAAAKSPPRYELAVAMMDDRDLHVVAYAGPVALPAEQRQHWIARLKSARLKPLATAVEPLPESPAGATAAE